MNEHSFIRSIHRFLSPDVYAWKIHDKFAGGVPDACYIGPAGLLFVEYKYVKSLPKRDDTLIRHSLSELQLQWLNRVSGPATAALIIGVEDTALIIPNDFSANISKMNYIEENISRREVADWIYSVTHSGRADEKKTPSSGEKSTQSLGNKKSRNAVYPG